jgi:transposase
MAIAVTRADHTADELRREARRSKDAGQARRLLAIALVLEGQSRTEAAVAAGMHRQTLRDWVHRYNAKGIAGLVDRPRCGRPASMSTAQLAELDGIVERQPDIATDGVVRWRCADLKRIIETRFGVTLSERSVGRILNERGFRRLSVRPRHPRCDEATQEAFKKALPRP